VSGMAKQEFFHVERYEPNYNRKCIACDQLPTVTAVVKGGKNREMDLCGPCCFGEAACIDPKVWNE
jgi:hypothetical protein